MAKELIIKGFRGVLGVIVILGIMLLLSYSEHHYTRVGFCKQVANGDYYFYDNTGGVWEFYTQENIPSESTVEVKMFSNCTLDDPTDDIIIDYQILKSELKIEVKKDF